MMSAYPDQDEARADRFRYEHEWADDRPSRREAEADLRADERDGVA